MNPRSLDKSILYSSGSIHLNDFTAEHLSSFQPENIYDSTLLSNSDGSHMSMFLHKDTESKKMLPERSYHSNSAVSSTLINSGLVELNSNPSRGSTMGPLTTRMHSSPVASASGPRDWSLNCGHHAKRARVENIIRGMTSCPGRHFTGVITEESQHKDLGQENKRGKGFYHYDDDMQRGGAGGTTSDTSPKNQRQRKRHQNWQRPLRHLRAKCTQEYGGNESEEEVGEESVIVEENHPTWNNDSPETSPGETFSDPYIEFETPPDREYQGWKKMKLMNYIQSKPDRVNRLMADILKYELSRAVNMSVDSIFQNIPLQRLPHDDGGKQTNNKSLLNLQEQSSFCRDSKSSRLSCSESTVVQIPEVQTEALSLVVEKPPQAFNRLTVRGSQRLPQPPLPFTHRMVLHEDQPFESVQNSPLPNTLRGFQDGYPRTSQPRLETFDLLPWNSVKVRSKANFRSIRGPQSHPMAMDPMLLESLCLPHVKIESDVLQSMVTNNTHVLNEGLTSNHLKKAKLMFFFTRYPSSTVLKTFFRDVQFTRCITSQLIKWFSNFREFYYIQMEKHARHAVVEGVADVRDLSVGRESELFRALNMHYNKANDFQVPERFLEVAEITLREFYIAISMGKDSDPSWKKAIYKVISKLDSDVPADFKSHPFT